MSRRNARKQTPSLMRLESREALTVFGVHVIPPDVLGHAQYYAATKVSQISPPNGPVPTIISGPGQPLPIEIARTRFSASFAGPFSVGPPHYTGQSALLYYRGFGTSTEFLHGDYQMIIVLPKMPGGPITGAAYLQDKNQAGGNQVGIDINFDTTKLDKKGRPTFGAWITDPNIYSGSNFFNSGSGTLQIRYAKNGQAAAFFKGHNYTNGITNVFGNDPNR